MPWHARLQLDYHRDPAISADAAGAAAPRTLARYLHNGPLRILQSLYPEGDAVCHNVLVHPPGGLVGGDTLEIQVSAATGTHGLVTTPGATRFYRSDGAVALQDTQIHLAAGARLEWLPLETLCYSGCQAENRLQATLDAGAEMLGWDITALGLPHAHLPFVQGTLRQHIEVPGVWLEQGQIDARDTRLMDGPLGLAGHRCMATLFFLAGTPLERTRREAALDVARAVINGHDLRATAGATSPDGRVVVVRVLAPVVEPAMYLMRQIRAAWRQHFWQQPAVNPRIWST